jgi:hypothetical protein
MGQLMGRFLCVCLRCPILAIGGMSGSLYHSARVHVLSSCPLPHPCRCSCWLVRQRRENVLHWLAKRSLNPSHTQRVFRLLEAVCEDREVGVAGLNAANLVGDTPLHIAVAGKHPKLLALMLRRGANPTLVSQVSCELRAALVRVRGTSS